MNYLDKTGLTRLWSKVTGKLGQKQDTLVSGTNIKTINNQSILGSGNINISGGSGGASTDVQMNGTSIVSNDVANIITESPYNSSTNPLVTKTDLNKKQDKLTTSTWRYVIPGVVYEHAEGFVGNAIVNVYSDASSTYNVQTIISNATSQETLYLNNLEYPLVKHVLGEPGDETYVLSYNVDFSEGEYVLGIERVDTTKPCFVVVLGMEPESPSGHVLIIVSTEEIRRVPWAFVKENDVEYVAPVAISGDYNDLVNKPPATIVVNTFEELPYGVENYSLAYVKNSSLYDITTLSSYNYDNTQMNDVSAYPEPDFSLVTHDQNESFGLIYNDMFGEEFVASLTFTPNSALLLIGGVSVSGGYIYSENPIDDPILTIPQGWSYLLENAGVCVPITFNDVPLVPINLMTQKSATGNVYNADYFFCDCKKHWVGEYVFTDGTWEYQGTVITPFVDDSFENVPSSNLIYKIIVKNSAILTEIQTALSQLGG